MIYERDPKSKAAREVYDMAIRARVAGEISQEALDWVGTKAFEQFREEALRQAQAQISAERKKMLFRRN